MVRFLPALQFSAQFIQFIIADLSLQKYYIQGFKIKFALLLNCTIISSLIQSSLFYFLLLEDTKQTFSKRNAVICSHIILQEVLG